MEEVIEEIEEEIVQISTALDDLTDVTNLDELPALDSDYDLFEDIFGSSGDESDSEPLCDPEAGECEEDPLCAGADVECDDYGNVITDDGFFDENGRWVDMTNYVEDPAVSAAIDAALSGAGAAKKSGKNSVPT